MSYATPVEEIEAAVRELVRRNPGYTFAKVLKRVQTNLSFEADAEVKRRIGEVYAEERARINAPRERFLGMVMALFGGVMLVPGGFFINQAVSDVHGFLEGFSIRAIVLLGIISAAGVAFVVAGLRGIIKGRTPNPGIVDELNELGS